MMPVAMVPLRSRRTLPGGLGALDVALKLRECVLRVTQIARGQRLAQRFEIIRDGAVTGAAVGVHRTGIRLFQPGVSLLRLRQIAGLERVCQFRKILPRVILRTLCRRVKARYGRDWRNRHERPNSPHRRVAAELRRVRSYRQDYGCRRYLPFDNPASALKQLRGFVGDLAAFLIEVAALIH
jgi:hypothetical protein